MLKALTTSQYNPKVQLLSPCQNLSSLKDIPAPSAHECKQERPLRVPGHPQAHPLPAHLYDKPLLCPQQSLLRSVHSSDPTSRICLLLLSLYLSLLPLTFSLATRIALFRMLSSTHPSKERYPDLSSFRIYPSRSSRLWNR